MENNNRKDPDTLVQGWLDEIMRKLDIPEAPDLGADEQAVASAGLTHPDDLELEKIVQETLAENWGEEFAQETPVQEDTENSTRFFVPPQPQEPENEIPAEPTSEEPVLTETEAEDVDMKVVETAEPEAEEAQEDVSQKPKNMKKKRPFLFGIPALLATAIWLVVIVVIGLSAGRALWAGASDLLALGKKPQEITLTIAEDDDLSDVANKLEKAGMIEYPSLFKAFAKLTKKGNNMLVGNITFNNTMVYDYNAIINALSYRSSSRVTIDVMIPEGNNCAQIFELLEKKGVCTVSELEQYAASGELGDYWFLDGITRGHKYCLEGFMFPDTYEFYVGDEPGRVITKFLNNFEAKFNEELIDKMVALNNKTGLNLDVRKIVIMASIVEKEKASDLEGYTVASVFYNRLINSAKYPFLNSDATVLYDVDYYSKGQLTTNEQINASPYNTYTNRGLPVGPIANPGLSSLGAALDPEDTDYFYFIYDKSAGVHRFSKNLVEHTNWAKKLGLS